MLADRLAVAHLRPPDVGLHLELAQHAVDDHLEVELAHARDAGLGAFLVGADPEGRVLLGQALQGDRHLVLVGLGLWLDRQLDHRLREADVLEHDRLGLVAQRVAGGRVLEPDRRGDVAGADRFDLLAMVGVQLQEAADALLGPLGRVVDVGAGLQRAGVDPEEGQLADERVRRDLEGERGERLVRISWPGDLVAGARVDCR